MITHRDLDAHRVSREIVLILVRLSRERWRPWAAALFSQVLRSSLSVQLNIAEGYAFGHVPARVRHYRVAYGSAAETSEICDLLIETGIVNEEETGELLTLSHRSRELCWGLIRSELARRKTDGEAPGHQDGSR